MKEAKTTREASRVLLKEGGVQINQQVVSSLSVTKDKVEMTWYPYGILVKSKLGETFIYSTHIKQVDLIP